MPADIHATARCKHGVCRGSAAYFALFFNISDLKLAPD